MNSFGKIFRVSIFGESHGNSVGVTIDGCPAGLIWDDKEITNALEKRKPKTSGTTKRIEEDKPIIISGITNGKTNGAPITVIFNNKNYNSSDYSNFKNHPRPGHADFTAKTKYNNHSDFNGGGHFSGRLTLGMVLAGYFAKKIINPISIKSKIKEIGGKEDFDKILEKAIREKESLGALINCECNQIPIGLGEPFFDSAESLISHAIFSIPGVKGIEFGSGFASAKMFGSEHNDLIINTEGKTKTNNSGGINGGITNGNPILFNIAIKPTSSIGKEQLSWSFEKNEILPLEVKGRHDSCFALRLPIVIEAVTAIALADLLLLRQSQMNTNSE